MTNTVLGNGVEFLAKIGIYDVVLPFLLVFTLVFAFLEKSKALGVEIIKDDNGKEHVFTRKNLNSIVAFTAAFFVIASSQLVRIISEVLANTIILVVAGTCFALVAGLMTTKNSEGKTESFALSGPWKTGFWFFSLIGISLILLNALGWLDVLYEFLVSNWHNGNIGTLIMIGLFVWLISWLTKGNSASSSKPKKED